MAARRKKSAKSSSYGAKDSGAFYGAIDINKYSKLDSRARVATIAKKRRSFLIIQIIGLIAALLMVAGIFFGWPKNIFGASLELFAPAAYAQTTAPPTGIFFKDLKSVILSGLFFALFLLFIWALYTLYNSPNRKAVDVAVEAVKTLSGFFVGALTGFLGG